MMLAKSIWTPILALDRLNSWLRSDQPIYCPVRSALKPIIYWTKTKSILETSKREQIKLRRVKVRKPCRKCDGTGTWVPQRWGGWEAETYEEYRNNYGEPCWGCKATGTATLLFVESQLGPVRWHTPAEKWRGSSLDVYVPFDVPIEFEHYEETNWEPNQKGRPMLIPDVERDMLIILNSFPVDVSFSIDFHHHTRIMPQWRCPHVDVAEAWIKNLCRQKINPCPV